MNSTITIRIDKHDRELFTKRAKALGKSPSEILRSYAIYVANTSPKQKTK